MLPGEQPELAAAAPAGFSGPGAPPLAHTRGPGTELGSCWPRRARWDHAMNASGEAWAVVLAAGDGTRLAALTTDPAGNPVPKQYCSLNGGPSLLQEAIARAARVLPRERICIIVAERHRRYWEPALWFVPPDNIIVQPCNRGTAHGVLLATLAVLARDPLACIAFLPADHHVRNEAVLAHALRRALSLSGRGDGPLALVGLQPHEADPELGYILPGPGTEDGSSPVERFLEKPGESSARELVRAGALWNSFIFASRGTALIAALRQIMPETVEDMATALARDGAPSRRHGALHALYEGLASVDFSRSVLQHRDTPLRVVAAAECGWTDLGTPERLAATLRWMRTRPEALPTAPRPRILPGPPVIDLSHHPLLVQSA